MLRKPAHWIFYLNTLQKPAAGAGFCNVFKYKADTFNLRTIQKPAPDVDLILVNFGPSSLTLAHHWTNIQCLMFWGCEIKKNVFEKWIIFKLILKVTWFIIK